ncbi:tyrosine-type recombinase/integrase [Fundidesulfovibrio putealis]|uniref:tyrosine-type recombinase/integrase n=1 Tax=Fundidesulfovibrio putealis TaxID=270496 RepID=UPI0005BC74ED|nr:site-specific integrase [Fundidesulfovibrio putealis]
MKARWNRTPYPGVRFREHGSRRHSGKPDRYFSIRYYINYKDCEEGLGWASEGWNAEKAHGVLARIKKNIKTGSGPQSLADLRAEGDAQREAEAQEARRLSVQGMTVSYFLTNHYMPEAKRSKRTWRDDDGRVRKIIPRLGHFPLAAVTRDDIRAFLDFLRQDGASESTALHYMAVLRRAYNMARVTEVEGVAIFSGQSPLEGVALPKPKNARERFLSYDEADALIQAAHASGQSDLHAAIVLAMNTGMRLGEILRLEWVDVDLTHGVITVREEQSRKPGGKVFINADVETVLRERLDAASCSENASGNGVRKVPGCLVLTPPKGGKERSSLTHRFAELVTRLGFNTHVKDARHKVVFHTLRHTFASWLAIAGTDIYRIKTLMRHKTITMTMRYAHLIPDATRAAVHNLRPANGATGS